MRFKHPPIGDKGQRFEISVFDTGMDKRIVAAWSDSRECAYRVAEGFETRPGWKDAQVLDRGCKIPSGH